MRIIAGEFGGRQLAAPRDERTRPMLEQSRAAVFNMLGPAVEGARVLDLYSGTGSLGLEAISRGAESVVFVERDRVALECLRRNIDDCGVSDRCRVIVGSVPSVTASHHEIVEFQYSIIFLDPPYPDLRPGAPRAAMLQLLNRLAIERLAPGGWIVFHHPTGALHVSDFEGLSVFRSRNYGRNSVVILHNDQNNL